MARGLLYLRCQGAPISSARKSTRYGRPIPGHAWGRSFQKKRIFYLHETGLPREVAETLIYFTVRAS